MPNIRLPQGYYKNGRFSVHGGKFIIEWGIKIHISAKADNAQTVADAALPVLRAAKVHHKVITDSDNLADQSDPQNRKFITVYPQSGQELTDLLAAVEKALKYCKKLPGGPYAEANEIPGDMAYGTSGYVFMRYGNFMRDHIGDDRANISAKLNDFWMHDIDVFEVDKIAAHRAKLMAERD